MSELERERFYSVQVDGKTHREFYGHREVANAYCARAWEQGAENVELYVCRDGERVKLEAPAWVRSK